MSKLDNSRGNDNFGIICKLLNQYNCTYLLIIFPPNKNICFVYLCYHMMLPYKKCYILWNPDILKRGGIRRNFLNPYFQNSNFFEKSPINKLPHAFLKNNALLNSEIAYFYFPPYFKKANKFTFQFCHYLRIL